MTPGWEAWLPVLVHIQASLDDDLTLSTLARYAGCSPSQLQRQFTVSLGETPKQYVSRLRLERAAFRLLVHDTTVMQIALDCGYRNHETFTRAFRRRFGCVPSAWRVGRKQAVVQLARASGVASGYELSATRIVRLRPQHLAFVRHVGPYEDVPGSLFDELDSWAHARRLPGPRVWMGIGHDAPDTTPPDRLRFDAALVVASPFVADGRIGCQRFDGGEHAVTTHVGPFETLPAAYAHLLPRVLALPGFRLMGVPAVEIYHAAQVDVHHRLNQTDLCLPVQRVVS